MGLLAQAPPPAAELERFVKTLGDDGRWPDVDYANRSRARWSTVAHLNRTRAMSLAWASEGCPLQGDRRLKGAVDRALDHWLRARYQNPDSWWWNEIGVPRVMREIVVLLGDGLTGERRSAALEVIAQTKMGGVGANLTWTAELQLHHACLTGRSDRVAEAAAAIRSVIVVGATQGIQDDGSFYQHKARLQAFAYGESFLDTVVQLAWQLEGTPWALPQDRRVVLSDYVLEGLQWMCRGIYTVPSTLDREVSRVGALRTADLRPVLRKWLQTEPPRQAEIETFLARQEGRGPPLVGHRHFPRADFTVHHRPAFSFFLKTVSDRTLPTESINDENLKGRHLHAGDHYVLRDGLEYFDLPPVWDWDRLPGVTLAEGGPPLQRRAFVGCVTNGHSGLTAMDYRREREDGTTRLAVRKAWACHGDVVVCLIGGWRLDGLEGGPCTTLDQCRLRGPVLAMAGAGPARELAEGRHEIEDAAGILHAGVAYMPLSPSRVALRLGPAVGSWQSVNGGLSGKAVSEPVFLAVMRHGSPPAATGFAIAGGVDREAFADLVERPSWRVLRNDARCQALRFADGTHAAAFYRPGVLAADGTPLLQVDRPCLALWTDQQLWLCDPTGAGGTVEVTWQGRRSATDLPAGGWSAQVWPRPPG